MRGTRSRPCSGFAADRFREVRPLHNRGKPIRLADIPSTEPSMPDPRPFQLVIVGSGPGGYVAAIRAAQLGLKTAIVERDQLGGTCLNWGCIPTKAWIVTAHLLEQIRRAKEYGIEVGEPKINWGWLLERKQRVVKQLTGGVKTPP